LAAIVVLGIMRLASAQQKQRLTVFAAASLTDAFRTLGDTLQKRMPGLVVAFNFAGSQQLAAQILEGAPADVFASADDHWMTVVRDSGFLGANAKTFATNRLIVIVPKTNPARIGKLQDLARSGVKLVLAAPAVPAGQYARLMINNLARDPSFGGDFAQRALGNVVSQEQNVRAVVTKVQLGEADAGVCYVSDVPPTAARDVRVFEVPEASNVIAQYPIAIVKHAGSEAAARAFVDLVTSPTGQAVLASYRFGAAAP
jgi:molybdate transport system substrate-binding protein